MPSVFFSYARQDLPLVEQLATHLASTPGLSLWRDQEKIYGGQKWPKVLGEAIAEQDVFLLAWSKAAAESYYVEFEWCTAIALKKTIVPCLLDDTPLAPSLTAIQAHQVTDIDRIAHALRAAAPADARRRSPVIHALDGVTATEPRAVLAEAKSVFASQHWTVQGNVYQAGGDIHIHATPSATPSVQEAPERDQPLIKKWQAWAGLAVALLTIVTLLWGWLDRWSGPTVSNPIEQKLAGMVLDEATGQPLQDVLVTLPDFDMRKTTGADGSFHFRVTDKKQARIKFTAQKDGYRSYSNYATLGNSDLRFPLEKSQ